MNLSAIRKGLLAAILSLGGGMASAWPDAPTEAWQALAAAAQAEGTVVVMGPAELEGAVLDAFEAATGLETVFALGSRSEGRARFFRETESDQATFDVYIGGRTNYRLGNAGKLAEIAPHLLPEVTDPAAWKGDAMRYVDKAQTYTPAPVHYASGFVLVNSDMIDPATIRSWDDLMAAELTGKIVMHDATIRGAGLSVATYLAEVKGADYLAALYNGQVAETTTDYRQLVDWVARGTYPIAIGALSRDIERYRDQGLTNLAVVRMQDHPGYVSGGASIPAIPVSAPHPNAALVFVNWFLSKDGQQAFSDATTLPSDRRDVAAGGSPDYLDPGEDGAYVDQYSEEWIDTVERAMIDRVKAATGQ